MSTSVALAASLYLSEGDAAKYMPYSGDSCHCIIPKLAGQGLFSPRNLARTIPSLAVGTEAGILRKRARLAPSDGAGTRQHARMPFQMLCAGL